MGANKYDSTKHKKSLIIFLNHIYLIAVNCGGYKARSCESCPNYRSRTCGGDCLWDDGLGCFKPTVPQVSYSPPEFDDAPPQKVYTYTATAQRGKPTVLLSPEAYCAQNPALCVDEDY